MIDYGCYKDVSYRFQMLLAEVDAAENNTSTGIHSDTAS
jgi:hypothetical protein